MQAHRFLSRLISGSTILAGLRDILFPPVCFSCGGAPVEHEPPLAGLFCARCLAAIRIIGSEACPQCGEKEQRGDSLSCRRCSELLRHHRSDRCDPGLIREGSGFFFFRCAAGAAYSGPVKDLVHRLKFSRERRASIPLGRLAALAAGRVLGDGSAHCVTPVPLHPLKRLRRGYNQAGLIARVVARELGLPFQDGLVRRVRFTPPQGKRGGEERRANLLGAFRHTRKACLFSHRRLLLVDDVVSTASTIDLCAAALHSAGIASVFAAAAAT